MTPIICRTPEEHDAAHKKMLAKVRARTGRRIRTGVVCDYLLSVEDEGDGPVFSLGQRPGLMMNAAQFALFTSHMVEASKAMKRRKPFYIAVYMGGVK